MPNLNGSHVKPAKVQGEFVWPDLSGDRPYLPAGCGPAVKEVEVSRPSPTTRERMSRSVHRPV